ncbi:MAG: hypothetical protein GY839_00630 [candidate division Zixibacteria bacterium]|nr:hypothetical protein [candidate division Zixibacteria bacterium]
MALKFSCRNCGDTIIVKYLNIGDKAKCLQCGSINTVPKISRETDKEPDPYKYNTREKTYSANKNESIFKPTGKQIVFSLIFGLIVMLLSRDPDDSDSFVTKAMYYMIGYIIIYIGGYLQTLFINEENEIQKFAHSASPKDGHCANCKKNIIKGELIFIKKDFFARIFRQEIILCIECYNDYKLAFMKPKVEKKKKKKKKSGFFLE